MSFKVGTLPYGKDPLFDQMYDLAINSGFNLLAEVLSTPRYGEYCESEDGRMIHLSTDPVLQGDTPYGIGFCKDPNDRNTCVPVMDAGHSLFTTVNRVTIFRIKSSKVDITGPV